MRTQQAAPPSTHGVRVVRPTVLQGTSGGQKL